MLSQSKSLTAADIEMQPKSPVTRGVKYSQSLRVKREGAGGSSRADRSSWSFGTMARALSTGVVQGTKAVSSGVVQGTIAVGSGVVQGSMAVGTGVVQGTKVVGTGVVQGTKVVGTGVVAAGRMTKDVTLAVSKDVVSAAVSGVSAASEATVSAGRVVTNASMSAVIDTTKWVREQSESFGYDEHESYTVLPGDTLESVAQSLGVAVYDLIRLNTLHKRRLIPGKQLLIPDESDQIEAHPDEIFVAIARFSLDKLSFKTSNGSTLMDHSPLELLQLSLDICETADSVPDLLPAHSTKENEFGSDGGGPSGMTDDTCDLVRQQQQCHIVKVDLTLEASRLEEQADDDVTIILEAKFGDPSQPNGESGEVEGSTDKGHLYRFRFPQVDLMAVHSYMDLWHADKLTKSDNFERHLTLESTGLDDFDDVLGPTLQDESSILNDRHAREINRSLPLKIQNQSWCLAYSTGVNGFSLQNLYRTVANHKDPFLVVIQDSNGFIFGAFLSCTPRISEAFIGTGKSWIFCFGSVERLATPAAADGDAQQPVLAVSNPRHLNVFHWSGRNEYFFRGTQDHLMIGAGNGKFGIFLDGDLHRGRIGECETFEGWPAQGQEMDFVISCLECWSFI
jgi:LysM repeat protein